MKPSRCCYPLSYETKALEHDLDMNYSCPPRLHLSKVKIFFRKSFPDNKLEYLFTVHTPKFLFFEVIKRVYGPFSIYIHFSIK